MKNLIVNGLMIKLLQDGGRYVQSYKESYMEYMVKLMS